MFRFSVRPNRANAINWRAWGPEAFEEARSLDKPIVVDLTAFWCAFCQRMDETAFSADEVIAMMNFYFVPIRVEDMQRPDVDLRYNQNGWPTIAFLTPTGHHLMSVNHMSPDEFVDVLVDIVQVCQEQRDAIADAVGQIEAKPGAAVHGSPRGVDDVLASDIVRMVTDLVDTERGGFVEEANPRHKLLHTDANDLLLYLFETSGRPAHLDHALQTLDAMRGSSLFDSEEGGFFRYSSKPDWNEPHREKLLADQGLLLGNYLHAYLLAERPSDRESAEGLIAYLDATLTSPGSSLFLGCQDYVRELATSPERTPGSPLRLISVIDGFLYTDANARVASSYLEASWILGRPDCRARAEQILDLLWRTRRAPGGGLFHYSDTSGELHAPGLLQDSVCTGTALLDAYRVLGLEIYLDRAKQVADEILARHRNPAGGFFDISVRGPAALQYPMTPLIHNSDTSLFLLKLAAFGGRDEYREAANAALGSFRDSAHLYGAFAGCFGQAATRILATPSRVTLAGTPGASDVRALARDALTSGHRNLWLQFREGRSGDSASISM